MADRITRQAFETQFPNLILTSRDLPRKAVPFHTLLVSTILRLKPERTYTEAEINAELQRWILEFGRSFKLEHAQLRRYLVDEGYLARDSAGASYIVRPSDGPFTFDPDIRDLDLASLVAVAKAEREARKRVHTDDRSDFRT
jgi:hypothetical protein